MPTLTPIPDSPLHKDSILAAAPAWLASANEPQRRALQAAFNASLASATRWADAVGALQTAVPFCAQRLNAALKSYYGQEVDLEKTVFFRRLPTTATQVERLPALQAAMRNFTSNMGNASAFGEGSGLRHADGLLYEIAPDSFVRTCRNLDLGRLYQDHLAAVFEPDWQASVGTASREQLKAWGIEADRDVLTLEMRIAHMKGDLDDDAVFMLEQVFAGHRNPHYRSEPVAVCGLSLFEASLHRLMVISAERSGAREQPCVLYVPGDPQGALKQYPSASALTAALTRKLQDEHYRGFFAGFVPYRQRSAFANALYDRLFPWTPMPEYGGLRMRKLDPSAHLAFSEQRLPAALFDYRYEKSLAQLKDDARALAVPVADVDAEQRLEAIESWVDTAANLITLIAMLVQPVEFIAAQRLAHALAMPAAVWAGHQLLGDVFEGAQSWNRGQMQAAMEHLFAVLDNLAGAAALGVAGGFVEGLVPVRLNDGSTRLWHPDLTPFASDVRLPPALAAIEHGYFQHQGREFVALGQHVLEVERHGHQWQIKAQGPSRYVPALERSGEGAWRHVHETPQQWSGAEAVRRFGLDTQGLDARALGQVLDSTGLRPAQLAQLHLDGAQPPALLVEQLARARVQQAFETAAQALESGQPVGRPLFDPVALLAKLPRWPGDVAIEVADGAATHLYGAASPALTLRLNAEHLSGEGFSERVLAQLDESRLQALFGDAVGNAADVRAQTLNERLARQLRQHQPDLVAQRLEVLKLPPSPRTALLRRDFPGLCEPAALELLAGVDSRQLARMSETQRVPLTVAERARWYLKQARLGRAIEGFALPHLAGEEHVRLVIGLLEEMPGWSGRVRLEVRHERLNGALVIAVGEPNGELKRLVGHGGWFIAHDAMGNALSSQLDLFNAILRGLPDFERDALGVHIGMGEDLAERLRELALSDRGRAARVLGIADGQPWFRPPQRLNGALGYPLSGRARPLSPRQRLRNLYPSLDEDGLELLIAELSAPPAAPVGVEVPSGVAPGFRPRLTVAQLAQRQEQEWRALQGVLDGWQRTAPVHTAEARAEVAQRLRRAWRREDLQMEEGGVEALPLSGFEVGELPILLARFPHVRWLDMAEMGLAQVDDFLESFPNLEKLDLSKNPLATVPPIFSRLPALEELLLDQVSLRSEADVLAPLRGNLRLRALMLSNNDLVELPGFMDDLVSLSSLEYLDLRGNALTFDDASLARLGSLHRLAFLNLNANGIACTGEAFASWRTPHLAGLAMGYNQIALSEAGARALGNLTSLGELYLPHNPLGRGPDLTGLIHLRTLNLARCNLGEWPEGLSQLLNLADVHLRHIDLEGNGIRELPALEGTNFIRLREAEIGSRQDRFALNLDGNPLSDTSRGRLLAARLPISDLAVANVAVDEAGNIPWGLWLEGSPEELHLAIDDEYSRLAPGEAGRDFFFVLSQVPATAAFRLSPQSIRQRLWALARLVLEGENDALGLVDLREALYRESVAVQTCGDGMALVLNRLESLVKVWRTAYAIALEGEASFRPLIDISNRMLRLDLMNRYAEDIASARIARLGVLNADDLARLPGLHPLDDIDDLNLEHGVDAAEVRLRLQQRLRLPLNLPIEPVDMRYGTEVSDALVERVRKAVLRDATPQALGQWLPQQFFWKPYIERFYRPELERVRELWAAVLEHFELAISEAPFEHAYSMDSQVLVTLQAHWPAVTWSLEGRPVKVALTEGRQLEIFREIGRHREEALDTLITARTQELLKDYPPLP